MKTADWGGARPAVEVTSSSASDRFNPIFDPAQASLFPALTYEKCGRGSLSQAREKRTEKSPDYIGKLEIRGEAFKLTGWKRVGDDGRPWLSLSVEPAGAANTKPAPASADPSDVPF